MPPVDDYHQRSIGLLLRLLHQHWTAAVEAALDDAGFGDVRPPHANVFTFVPDHGIQVSELTRLAHVRKQTMAQAVEEMQRLGYVERRADPNDGRARLVFLTERGKRVKPIAVAAGRRVEAQWIDLIGKRQLDALRRSLQSALRALGSTPSV
jgi:DNA-binding MarR family transcriptional regulator